MIKCKEERQNKSKEFRGMFQDIERRTICWFNG